ncbi:MAG: 4Fe-4S ferredoxin, partial [Rhabdaerophilum sp.]
MMADISSTPRKGAILALCSCERTFSPDEAVITRGLKAAGQEPAIVACSQLCGADRHLLGRFAGASTVTIACEQEQASLRTGLSEAGFAGEARFVDIRDRAGWGSEGATAGPKMAALLATAQLPMPALPFFTMESQGVTLVYGRDEVALEVAARLADTLDITVMLAKPGAVVPPRNRDFPIACGVIRQAKGHLGTFELMLDGFALA